MNKFLTVSLCQCVSEAVDECVSMWIFTVCQRVSVGMFSECATVCVHVLIFTSVSSNLSVSLFEHVPQCINVFM